MKVLLLNDVGAPIGGAEQMTLSLRDGLRERGHDARVFATELGSETAPSFADYACFGTVGELRSLNRVVNPAAAWRLRGVLRQFRPDVVHVRMFMTQLSPAILPLLRGLPTLYHAAWYEAVCPIGLKLMPDGSVCESRAGLVCYRGGCLSARAWVPLLLQQKLVARWKDVFDRVVANSAALQRVLRENGFSRTEVIWNGVPRREPRRALSDPPTISYAGRLSHEKGLDTLIRAVNILSDDLPSLRLRIAGEGPERANLEALVRSLGLQEQVTLLGHLPRAEMERQLDGAWLHVVPSRCPEPFGLSVAEAMMRGTAVVASRCGGVPEVIDEPRTGLLVPPNDPPALAEAIAHVAGDVERAERMGREGRERALAHFSLEGCVDRFVALYETMLGERAALGAARA